MLVYYRIEQTISKCFFVQKLCFVHETYCLSVQVQISYYGREWGSVEDASAQDLYMLSKVFLLVFALSS